MKRILFTALCLLAFLSCQKTEKEPVMPEKVVLNASSISIVPGVEYLLEATVLPADATDKSISWTSEDNNVASVSGGVVTAKAVGKTLVTATSCNGKKVSCEVSVVKEKISVTGVSLEPRTLVIRAEESSRLTATVTPADATDTSLVWRTDNERVAVVVDGVVQAIAIGKAVITATSSNGKMASCDVTVLKKRVRVTGISLEPKTLILHAKESYRLTANVIPADATDTTVLWKSDNSQVAVIADGIVTAINVGKAIIQAKSNDGQFTDECEVTVEEGEGKSFGSSAEGYSSLGGYIWN